MIFAERVAPRTKRVSQFERKRHAGKGIEIDHAACDVLVSRKQNIRDLGVAVNQTRIAGWRRAVIQVQALKVRRQIGDYTMQPMIRMVDK